MDALEDEVALRVGYCALALGIAAPEHLDKALVLLGDDAHDGIGELLPALSCVRSGLVGSHREDGVEKKDSLLSPAIEVAARWGGGADVVVNFLEDIL